MSDPIHIRLANQIVDTLKSICNHDINYIDMQGKIRASTDASRIGDYHLGGLEAIRSGENIRITEEKPGSGMRKGINMPITHHGEIIAVIGITGEVEEVEKYAYLAQHITQLLLREHELDRKMMNRREQTAHIIHRLLNNERIPEEYLNSVLKQNHIDSADGLWQTAAVRVNPRCNSKNLSLLEPRISQAFEQTGSCIYTFRYPNEYILMTKGDPAGLRSFAEKYGDLLRIGIGTREKLTRQHLSYQAALLAVKSLPAGKNCIMFDELDLEILLAEVSGTTADAYVKRFLGPLSEEDCRILDAYFRSGMSLKKTAEELFLHKNTLQYRLNRIREKSTYDPRVFREAVVLYTAMKLGEIGG